MSYNITSPKQLHDKPIERVKDIVNSSRRGKMQCDKCFFISLAQNGMKSFG